MEAASISVKSVNFYHSTWHYNPKEAIFMNNLLSVNTKEFVSLAKVFLSHTHTYFMKQNLVFDQLTWPVKPLCSQSILKLCVDKDILDLVL
jgi:hypothetical protein